MNTRSKIIANHESASTNLCSQKIPDERPVPGLKVINLRHNIDQGAAADRVIDSGCHVIDDEATACQARLAAASAQVRYSIPPLHQAAFSHEPGGLSLLLTDATQGEEASPSISSVLADLQISQIVFTVNKTPR